MTNDELQQHIEALRKAGPSIQMKSPIADEWMPVWTGSWMNAEYRIAPREVWLAPSELEGGQSCIDGCRLLMAHTRPDRGAVGMVKFREVLE